ncbi:PHB depolymerase family esterase [Corallococcus terminator]|uniref:Phospholipase n=1 Tax=Corallococcus terminator TaxID=2316733 RepID=A0A3A8JBA9_9BACT|nr:PHB depolymerase family esterase [Corallococcus terminator]RKG92735.1 phospholipase [Corallococcus terminator]
MRRQVVALFISLCAVACGGGFEEGAPEEWGTHAAALVTPTTEDVVVARLPATTGAGYGYGEYLPPGYLTSTTRYPVVIHLNGAGEFGTSTTEADLLNVVTRSGALKNIRYTSQGKTYFGQRGVMVFTPRAATSWQPAELDAFVSFLVANYRVDTTRIYMTGLSFGGYGSWKYAYTYGSRLAALAPMASNIGAPGPTITQLLNVPVWAVHSHGDSITYLADRSWLTGVTKNYGVSQQLVVPAPSSTVTYLFPTGSSPAWTSQPGVVASGNARARFTVLPGTHHDCWTQQYNNYAFWDWLLAQQRTSTP